MRATCQRLCTISAAMLMDWLLLGLEISPALCQGQICAYRDFIIFSRGFLTKSVELPVANGSGRGWSRVQRVVACFAGPRLMKATCNLVGYLVELIIWLYL